MFYKHAENEQLFHSRNIAFWPLTKRAKRSKVIPNGAIILISTTDKAGTILRGANAIKFTCVDTNRLYS